MRAMNMQQVINIDGSGEQRLVAAMLIAAVADANAEPTPSDEEYMVRQIHDLRVEARTWLERASLDYLELLVPPDMDAEGVHAALLKMIGGG